MRPLQGRVRAAVLALTLVLAGCGVPLAERAGMETTRSASLKGGKPIAMQVVVMGAPIDNRRTAVLKPEELQAAIEASLLKAGLVQSVQVSDAAYRLEVRVVDVASPSFGFNTTVSVEIAWVLRRISTEDVVIQRSIRTEHMTWASESIAGNTRFKMSAEAAVRKNIDWLLTRMAELPP